MSEIRLPHNGSIFNILVIFLIIFGPITPLSCIKQTPPIKIGTGSNSHPIASEYLVFRSSEFIICKLNSKETPESLAKVFLGSAKKAWIIEDANKGSVFEPGQIVVIPLKQNNIGGITDKGYQTVPVLGYQRLGNNCKTPSCISKHAFDQQMRYLKENGFRVISTADLFDFLYYKHPVPKRSVVITIENGYDSTFNIVFPILKKYGFNATLFIDAGSIGVDQKTMSWNQIRELKNAGFEIGSYWIPPNKMNRDEKALETKIKKELILLKKTIDEKLSQNTKYIAIAAGQSNQRLLNIWDQVGYRIVFTSRPGSNPFFADPLLLKRNLILKQDMKNFTSKLKTFHKSPLR